MGEDTATKGPVGAIEAISESTDESVRAGAISYSSVTPALASGKGGLGDDTATNGPVGAKKAIS